MSDEKEIMFVPLWLCEKCNRDKSKKGERIEIFNNGQNSQFRFTIWQCPICHKQLIEILLWNKSNKPWDKWNNKELTGGIYDL